MGLREKVALIIVFIAVEQIIFTCCSSGAKTRGKSYSSKIKEKQNIDAVTHAPIVISLRPQIRSGKSKNKRNPDANHEALRKTFNFPDVEYPFASTPRPPYYLQETDILQKNPIQIAAEYPTLTTVQYAINNQKNVNNLNKKSKSKQMKTTKKPGVTITLSEFGTTPKPYCFRNGDFPDVEYPLSAKDTWKPNYWKPISSGPTNDNNKSGHIPKQSVGALNHVSVTARIDTAPRSQSNKRDSNNKHQVPGTSSANNDKKIVNNNNQHVVTTGEFDQNDVIKIEIHTTPITQATKTKKINNQRNQYTTPALTRSEDTKSTDTYAMTPFTTLYLDTTPSYIDTPTSLTAECESTTPSPKKTNRKKKAKKKDGLPKQSKKTTLTDDDTLFTSSPPSSHIYENQIDSYKAKESSLRFQCLIAPLPEEPYLSIIQQISEGNGTKADSCFYMSNDTLNTHAVTTNSTCFSSNINLTTISEDKMQNDYKIPISVDNNVASISDAINTIVHDNRDSEEASCFEDNAANCHKSMTCDRKSNDSLSRRADVIDSPSADEEFTTDVFPDFDENISGIFGGSTSTLSPLTLGTVDEAWVNSEVIDPYKSLSYSDELEQYYIMVP